MKEHSPGKFVLEWQSGLVDVAGVGLAEDGDVFIYRFETRGAEPGLYTPKEYMDRELMRVEPNYTIQTLFKKLNGVDSKNSPVIGHFCRGVPRQHRRQ